MNIKAKSSPFNSRTTHAYASGLKKYYAFDIRTTFRIFTEIVKQPKGTTLVAPTTKQAS